MGKLSISYPFILFTAALLALDTDGFFLLLWTAVLVHEIGHLVALKALRCGVDKVFIRLSGLRIEYSPRRQTSYGQDALAAAAGPAANVAFGAVLAGASKLWPSENLYVLIGANVVLAIFNLLPALPMDGGRIALALFSRCFDADRAASVVQASTGILGAGITAAGLWVLLETGGRSFVPLLTGFTVLIGSVGTPGREARQ